jgi:hypothetical protein
MTRASGPAYSALSCSGSRTRSQTDPRDPDAAADLFTLGFFYLLINVGMIA